MLLGSSSRDLVLKPRPGRCTAACVDLGNKIIKPTNATYRIYLLRPSGPYSEHDPPNCLPANRRPTHARTLHIIIYVCTTSCRLMNMSAPLTPSPPLLARGRPSDAGPVGARLTPISGARLTPLSLLAGERSPPLLAGRRPPRRTPPSLLSGGRSPPLLAGRRPRSRSPLLLAEGRPEAARRSFRPACRPAALEAVAPAQLAGRGEVLVEVEAEVRVLAGGLGESLVEAAELHSL